MRLFLILFLLFLFACGNNLPEEILLGERKCEYCKMGVVDENFHTQILTKKGRRFHFDSIECMFSYLDHNKENVDKIWLRNYANTREWIEVEKAKFLKSDKINSPMAANLSAYKLMEDAEAYRVSYGGVMMSQIEVIEYLKNTWEKEIRNHRKHKNHVDF